MVSFTVLIGIVVLYLIKPHFVFLFNFQILFLLQIKVYKVVIHLIVGWFLLWLIILQQRHFALGTINRKNTSRTREEHCCIVLNPEHFFNHLFSSGGCSPCVFFCLFSFSLNLCLSRSLLFCCHSVYYMYYTLKKQKLRDTPRLLLSEQWCV